MMNRQPTHPGEILKEDILPGLGLKAVRVAEMLGISPQYMSALLNGKKPFTPEFCLKVAKLVGNSPDMWMNMQARHDLWQAGQSKKVQRAVAHVPSYRELTAGCATS